MLVEDLIKILQQGNPKAEVVRIGHFGEPYQFDKYDFRFKDHYLVVEPPEIGPEPT